MRSTRGQVSKDAASLRTGCPKALPYPEWGDGAALVEDCPLDISTASKVRQGHADIFQSKVRDIYEIFEIGAWDCALSESVMRDRRKIALFVESSQLLYNRSVTIFEIRGVEMSVLRLMRLRVCEFGECQAAWHADMQRLATGEVRWAKRKRMWWSAKYASWWEERGRWHSRRKKLWSAIGRLVEPPS